MLEVEPRAIRKPEALDHIGSLGYLAGKQEPIAAEITEENYHLFTVFDRIRNQFAVPRQGTGYIVPALESFTRQYTKNSTPHPSPPLAAFMHDGTFIRFIAHKVQEDSNGSNGRAHHHVIDADWLCEHGRRLQIALDVNVIHCLSRALEEQPKLWEGDQA